MSDSLIYIVAIFIDVTDAEWKFRSKETFHMTLKVMKPNVSKLQEVFDMMIAVMLGTNKNGVIVGVEEKVLFVTNDTTKIADREGSRGKARRTANKG